MNYLAHLFLSPDLPAVRVGNLMGDFVKGNHLEYLPGQIRQGVYLHRAIDKFTDSHPQVAALKTLLSPQRKRFAGIVNDIVFDHLLAKYWHQYCKVPLSEFAELRYQELSAHKTHMPEKMASMVSRMIDGNWLVEYQSPQSVAGAINGVSRRIRFDNKLAGAAEEVMPVLGEYEQAFSTFFPDLQVFVQEYIDDKRLN
ncbi:acyl carrier protein phosphodiesterase [Thalassotalea euphylliae]|nr:ACP phosphodiesterase [Thalassotalea euphylliae]